MTSCPTCTIMPSTYCIVVSEFNFNPCNSFVSKKRKTRRGKTNNKRTIREAKKKKKLPEG